ncbi:uncharacterized protein LOC106637438 [Copidosoma floridanum]|uniref:uncharacterized protein LOC106637438 n=1 Tax=Copidosoma floridanum TaxID=29053 RepID=UPI0006C940D9|nr:uncharacterized protein LOC106637438 [Copidosoma floridanum]
MTTSEPRFRIQKLGEPKAALGSGDTYLLEDALPVERAVFNELLKEVKWHEMRHKGGRVPREISIQGSITRRAEDGHDVEPVYRHPADEQPGLVHWTPSVLRIKNQVEELVGQELNHALIQLYRDGRDFIGEHSDKTLDILKGSSIYNYSLGASRTMVLKHKETGIRQRLHLPHNSLLLMGWRTNREWLHEIRMDKRPVSEKRPDELAFNGRRISLTFRTIATFRDRRTGKLSGQGARVVGKVDDDVAAAAAAADERQKQQTDLLVAFSAENKTGAKFDWDEHYGRGFDVLNFNLVNTSGHQQH